MSLELSRVCSAISPSPTLAIDGRAKEMRAQGRDVVSFCAGEPDFKTPQYIRTAAHEALDMGLTGYTAVPGTIELRRAICDKLERDNGLHYTPAQIVVSNGAKASLYTAISVLLNPGDEVLIPTPCWVSYPEMVRLAGGVPVLVPGDKAKGFVVEAADLAPYVTERTKLLILNSPNNPNGCVWNREQLAGIAKLAVEKQFYVISDDRHQRRVEILRHDRLAHRLRRRPRAHPQDHEQHAEPNRQRQQLHRAVCDRRGAERSQAGRRDRAHALRV